VLPILLGALTAIFAAVLWLGSMFLQGWLYNDLARKLPLRALVGGIFLALFHVGWCAIYKDDPGRFDTLPNFKTEVLDGTYDEFQSVRKVGKEEQKPVHFVRKGDTNDFVSDAGKMWNRSDSDGMVVALLFKEKGRDAPTRFDATLKPDGTFPKTDETRYEAEKGKRYMDQVALGKVYRKRSMSVLGNLFANFLHLAVWVAVLWPIMRFSFGHAVAIAFGLWAVTMLVAQPALFGLVTK
jgi:hypothetical protein